jgi:DNA polymerase-3 subunit delta
MSGNGTVYLYVGDDEFALGAAAQQLIQKLVPEGERAFGLEVIEGRADNEEGVEAVMKRCLEALMTRGFLSAQGKVVWWRDVNFLADGQVAQAEGVKARVKEFVQVLKESPAGGNVLLITAQKVDKRSSLYKTCSDRFEVREFVVPEKSKEAENYGRATIRQAFAERKLRVSSAVTELFFAKVGSDTRQIINEVEKLALYVHGRPMVTEEDIDAIVSSSSESALWDIQDAVGRKQLSRALQILHRLLDQRESPIAIMTFIVNRLRDLIVYREALDKGWLRLKPGYGGGVVGEWDDLTPEVEDVLTVALKKNPRSMHPYRVGILAQQAQGVTAGALKRNQRLAMAAHESLVSSSVPEGTILELMLTKMMV